MGMGEYNGGSVLAMSGKNCVAIVCDMRFGVRQLMTVGLNNMKIHQLTEKCMTGLCGLQTDADTLAALLRFRLKMYKLEHERDMLTHTVKNMISSTLYEKRFGPYFSEPVVAGLDENNNPVICSYDFIGATSEAKDFCVSGTACDQLMGVAETFWRPDMEPDELFETISQCMLAAADRDCLTGWGATVCLMTPEGVRTTTLKGRMD